MSWDDIPQRRREAIQQMLTIRQLQVVSRRINGLSWRHIAIDLNITAATARQHYDAALDRLRKETTT